MGRCSRSARSICVRGAAVAGSSATLGVVGERPAARPRRIVVEAGHLLGIEVLGASNALAPETLARAEEL